MIDKVQIVVPPLVNRPRESTSHDKSPDFERYRLVSPVEPASVAADLLKRGFQVHIFDLGIHRDGGHERLRESIASFEPDVVVMVQSILTFATAQDWDGKDVFQMARAQSPQIICVLTGGHATNYPGRAVEEGICDYSIRGEVDFSVGDLLATLNLGDSPDSVPGVAYRRSPNEMSVSNDYPAVDVSKLPLPAYHLLDREHRLRYSEILEFGKIRFPEMSPHYRDIMTSRSCVLRCSFCSVAPLRGERQGRRRKSLEKVIAEIESALDDGIEEIHFFDDLFIQSEREALEFTNELTRRNLRFPWFVAQGMPLWPLTYPALAAMKEAGMYRIICPFESGNDRVLQQVIGKRFSSVELHQKVLEWTSELALEVIGMFVVGLPGEKRSEIYDTVRFAESHPQIDYSVFSIATPMVGTRLMKQLASEGKLADQEKINRIVKRTVALYRTSEFTEYEMGVIRTFDWDRINFSTAERRMKYARMVGISLEQLDQSREHSKRTFYRFFPDYEGPYSFGELYHRPDMYDELKPLFSRSSGAA
jgi:anaerobic magnesium-protoporphyrin IX monomethyl ester cyclase